MSAMPDIILEARDLAKHFGGLHAVDGVDLQVRAGSLHSIIGPNGAGKTTLFNLLSGYLKPTHGHVLLRGRDIRTRRCTAWRIWDWVDRSRSPMSFRI